MCSLLFHSPSDFEAFGIVDYPTHVGSLETSTSSANTMPAGEATPRHLAFNTDGTKMYVVGGTFDFVFQWTLTTGFDISTATYDGYPPAFNLHLNNNANKGDDQPRQLAFNTDGTKMFVVGNAADEINQYTLATGFDISSIPNCNASVVCKNIQNPSRIDITSTVGTSPVGLAFNTDGTKMFVTEILGKNALHEFTLTTGFDISTAINDGTHVISNVLAEQAASPMGIAFNTDGTKMFVIGNNINSIDSDDSVNEYILTTGFDITTATYDSTFDVSDQEPDPHGLAFSADGTKMFILGPNLASGAGSGSVNEYTLPTAFNIVDDGPTVTITTSNGNCGDTVSSTTLSYTVTFSESEEIRSNMNGNLSNPDSKYADVTDFVIGDITVTGTANGGSLVASNFAGSGTTYTFDVVRGSSDGTVSVSIAAGVATDVSTDENSASNTCTLTIRIPSSGSPCSRFAILGNCGTIAINNDVYRIIDTWTNVPTTEVLVGQPVTVTLSTPNSPTHTKIPFASVHTGVFSVPLNYEQSAHVDYSIMNNQVTYVSQSQLFQVAGATHRIVQDPDVKNLEMFEVVFTMIFAKPMETSHVVVETKNKFGIPETLYLMSALKVNENLQQALTLEEKSKFSIVDPESVMKPLGFVDPEKDPSHYVKRYLTEPKYKEWFDRNFPTYTIYDAIGITFAEYQEIESQLVDPEPEMEMDPEPEPTKKEKSKRQRR